MDEFATIAKVGEIEEGGLAMFEGTTVTCPCHGSQFDITTGTVRRPPADTPVSTCTVQIQGDSVQVQV